MNKEERIKLFDDMMGEFVPDEFRAWLIENGFFDHPASKDHHGVYEGGLFDHSYLVTKTLCSFTERLDLKWQKERSPYIVGMFHDLCKIDRYVRKDIKWGDYKSKEAWEYNNAPLLTGHGEKSVILLQQHMKLTDEEMLCIRWHHGAFDDSKRWNSYGRSVTNYPNVLYTHTADMVAARILGV